MKLKIEVYSVLPLNSYLNNYAHACSYLYNSIQSILTMQFLWHALLLTLYVYVCVCMFVCICVCVYLFVRVCMYVCVYFVVYCTNLLSGHLNSWSLTLQWCSEPLVFSITNLLEKLCPSCTVCVRVEVIMLMILCIILFRIFFAIFLHYAPNSMSYSQGHYQNTPVTSDMILNCNT